MGACALPQVETRSKYARLMRQGISNAEACRMLNINRRTGMRWRHGRTVKNAQGRETTYASISLKAPTTISSRYLSEGERIQIADALQVGKSLHQIAAVGEEPVHGQPRGGAESFPTPETVCATRCPSLGRLRKETPASGKDSGESCCGTRSRSSCWSSGARDRSATNYASIIPGSPRCTSCTKVSTRPCTRLRPMG